MWSRRPRLVLGCAIIALSLAAACGADAEERPADGQDGAGGDAATRTVDHAMGTAEVPANPEKVVVLDTGELDSVLALGVTPVGAVRADAAGGFLSYVADQVDDVELVGTINEPNLDKIAMLEPDLILSSTVRHEELYPLLDQIAPTVLAPDLGDTWKDNFRLNAEALGKLDEAETILTEFEERAAALGAELADPSEVTVSVVRFLPGQIRLYGETSFIGTILSDIGVRVPPAAQGEDVDTFVEVAKELVNEADGDHLVMSTYGPADETAQDEIMAGSLWQRLEPVRNDRVHVVDDDIWMTGIGIQAAQLTLTELESILTE